MSYFSVCQELPEGWAVTHLIRLDTDWQANLCDEEHVVVATGSDPGCAIISAISKIEREDYAGRLFHLAPLPKEAEEEACASLLASLGLEGKPFKRRRIG